MGCLTVHISQPFIPNTCRVDVESACNTISCNAQNKNCTVGLYKSNRNTGVTAEAISKNAPVKFNKANKNVKVNISIALVCQVSLGVYEYLYVTDGPLLVVNGYLMVRKQLS